MNQDTQIKIVKYSKLFVIIGSFEGYTQSQPTEMIASASGKVTSSVNPKTDFLLAGSNAGSKLQKAESFGTQNIDLTTLNAMMEGKDKSNEAN